MDTKQVMLIVDESEHSREIVAKLFRDEYDVIEASTVEEALVRIQEEAINVIILDATKPGFTEMEVLTWLKQDETYSGIPVIVHVKHGDSDTENLAIEYGAADYIPDPVNYTLLVKRVHNVMANEENKWIRMEQEAKNQQLQEMKRYNERDSLTGVYTRDKFYVHAAAKMQRNTKVQYEIIFLNINSFKVINDQYRMETGNLVLKTAAMYFKKCVANEGLVGRIEADHFCLCIPQGFLNMDDFIKGIDEEIGKLGIPHNIFFYAGIYPVHNAFLPVDQMCDRAHIALNKIKDNYLVRYAIYDKSMRDKLLEEQMIVRDMEFALQSRQFLVYLQPVYNLHTNHIVSAEALVRWKHPSEGLISPGKFIPVFEHNGFIVKLDRYVWEEVCRAMSEFRKEHGTLVPISVNVSRLDFYNLDLMHFLEQLIKKYDLEAKYLKLEVTESAYTDNPKQLIEIVKKFQEAGFPVLMDDFGSGYSSLNMLKLLPVDVLKIDMGFIENIERGGRETIIIESIVRMAKRLNMGIIVEGVETKEQIDFLDKIGCEDIQGYYFAKPMPLEEFTERLLQDIDVRKDEAKN